MSIEFEIYDRGIEHAQYFQGDGVALSKWTECAIGSGSSAKEAGEDALEQFWQTADKEKISTQEAEILEHRVSKLSPAEDAHDACHREYEASHPHVNDFATWDQECEMAHYVSIKWRYTP